MATAALQTTATVVLDGDGNGSVNIGPGTGVMWQLATASVQVSSAVAEPVCAVSLGSPSNAGTLMDATYTGSQDSTDRVSAVPVYPGATVWAVWTGGDPGATATLTLYGTYENGYRGAS